MEMEDVRYECVAAKQTPHIDGNETRKCRWESPIQTIAKTRQLYTKSYYGTALRWEIWNTNVPQISYGDYILLSSLNILSHYLGLHIYEPWSFESHFEYTFHSYSYKYYYFYYYYFMEIENLRQKRTFFQPFSKNLHISQ